MHTALFCSNDVKQNRLEKQIKKKKFFNIIESLSNDDADGNENGKKSNRFD